MSSSSSSSNNTPTTTSNSSTSTSTSSSNEQHPGLIAAHAIYVKGAAENLIGSVTGSSAWTASGEHDKQAAIEAMRAASKDREPAASGFGKVEEIAGKLTGCEGMEREGHASAERR